MTLAVQAAAPPVPSPTAFDTSKAIFTVGKFPAVTVNPPVIIFLYWKYSSLLPIVPFAETDAPNESTDPLIWLPKVPVPSGTYKVDDPGVPPVCPAASAVLLPYSPALVAQLPAVPVIWNFLSIVICIYVYVVPILALAIFPYEPAAAPAGTEAILIAGEAVEGEITNGLTQFPGLLPFSHNSSLVIVTLYSVAGPVSAKE